jgi:ATP synthase F1 delta subunit
MKATPRQLAATLYDLTAKQKNSEAEKTISRFVSYLEKQKKLKDVQKIIGNFKEIYNEKNGIVDAEIVSAKKLEGRILKRITDFVKKKYRAEEVVLRNIIDEKIKGGFVLKINDEVLDASVLGKIASLKKAITS